MSSPNIQYVQALAGPACQRCITNRPRGHARRPKNNYVLKATGQALVLGKVHGERFFQALKESKLPSMKMSHLLILFHFAPVYTTELVVFVFNQSISSGQIRPDALDHEINVRFLLWMELELLPFKISGPNSRDKFAGCRCVSLKEK